MSLPVIENVLNSIVQLVRLRLGERGMSPGGCLDHSREQRLCAWPRIFLTIASLFQGPLHRETSP